MRRGFVDLMTGRWLVAVASFLIAGMAAAETPDRARLGDNLLVTRRGYFNPIGERYGGIWTLNPETLDYNRIRAFLPTTDSDQVFPSAFQGQDGLLIADGDVLTYQTWPGLIDFDAYSWRMIRRSPTATDPAEVGWAVQGPTLDPETAALLGLGPGVYGIGRCVLRKLTSGLEYGWRGCGSWPFPPVPDPTTYGTDAAILWRRPRPGSGPVELFAEFEPNDPQHPSTALCLSFDLGRRGLWRCTPRSREVVLYSLDNGGLGPPIASYELTTPPLDDDDPAITRLFHHAATDRLFGTAFTREGDGYLFSIDAGDGEEQLLDEWSEWQYLGAPATLTALGPALMKHEQLLPIVAGGAGSAGTEWSTELWMFNPSADSTTVSVRRVTRPDQVVVVTLPPHGSLAVENALGWVGGGPAGDGTRHEALVVRSDHRWGEQLVVTGRISTPGTDGVGSYGHAVPSVPGRTGYTNHTQYKVRDGETLNVQSPALRASHLDLDRRIDGAYRHNLGVVNDLDEPITLRLIWGFAEAPEGFFDFRYLRPPENEVELTVPASSVRVFRLEALFPGEVRRGWPPRIALLGDRPAAVWLSMVDNRTGDATFVPFSSFGYENDNTDDRLVLPVVAHLNGVAGVQWRTDLYGYELNYMVWHSGAVQDEPFAVFRPADPDVDCGGHAADGAEISTYLQGEIGMPPMRWLETLHGLGYPWSLEDSKVFWRTVFPDAVHLFPECADDAEVHGALEIATASWFSGYSRTYAARADGGTYGGMLPLYPPGGWPAQHFAGLEVSSEQRINVGLYNGRPDHAIRHLLKLYSEDGALAASREVEVAPHRSVQRPLERLMGLADGSLGEGLYGLSVIPLDDPAAGIQGRSWAYVSLVDAVTNDPTNLW